MGKIISVSGPLVIATGLENTRMYNVVKVGKMKLMGEVIKIEGKKIFLQVYEDTSKMTPDEPVEDTGFPLMAELGPGLLSSIYDGIQRPLEVIKKKSEYISRGIIVSPLDRQKKWKFVPSVKKGDIVSQGDELGFVKEFHIRHKIMVPLNVSGKVRKIAKEGLYSIDDIVAKVGDKKISMVQRWPIRQFRPFLKKEIPNEPLITGLRIIDTLFPLAKGGTAAIPGDFGTGKTVVQHSLAKFSDADLIVYVGCGERGNEMTEILTDFPLLKTPKTNKSLMERTILIANTSNMPVAARESSIYLGAVIGEYYRDMGLNVTMMADSTSRWAESLREMSSRLGEIPGEEGYPAYLSSRVAKFYERFGKVKTFSGNEGSLSVISAISPPGGDFSEPMTQSTLKVVKVFWALDKKLAQKRHFPAINWVTSYSLYSGKISKFWGEEYSSLRDWLSNLLQTDDELIEIVQLVGSDALPDREKVLLFIGKMLKEDFLQQNAFSTDLFCEPEKQIKLLKVIKAFSEYAMKLLEEGKEFKIIENLPSVKRISRLKLKNGNEFEEEVREIMRAVML